MLTELTNILVQTVNQQASKNSEDAPGSPSSSGKKIKLPKLRVAIHLKEMMKDIVDVSTPMTAFNPMRSFNPSGEGNLSRGAQET